MINRKQFCLFLLLFCLTGKPLFSDSGKISGNFSIAQSYYAHPKKSSTLYSDLKDSAFLSHLSFFYCHEQSSGYRFMSSFSFVDEYPLDLAYLEFRPTSNFMIDIGQIPLVFSRETEVFQKYSIFPSASRADRLFLTDKGLGVNFWGYFDMFGFYFSITQPPHQFKANDGDSSIDRPLSFLRLAINQVIKENQVLHLGLFVNSKSHVSGTALKVPVAVHDRDTSSYELGLNIMALYSRNFGFEISYHLKNFLLESKMISSVWTLEENKDLVFSGNTLELSYIPYQTMIRYDSTQKLFKFSLPNINDKPWVYSVRYSNINLNSGGFTDGGLHQSLSFITSKYLAENIRINILGVRSSINQSVGRSGLDSLRFELQRFF